MSYPYTRYLASKKSVDDRALHQGVVAELRRQWRGGRVLEIGAGLGTMVARLLEWELLSGGDYVLLDVDRQLLLDSRLWLCEWAEGRGLSVVSRDERLELGDLRVHFVEAEIGDYLSQGLGQPADLLIANAFLDLVEVPATLPGLFRLLVPGGLYWFTINFDGETIFQPDHPYDQEFMRVYHRGMDERVRYGRPAGESRCGRHLYHHLRAAGAPPLASGSSDWVVHARPDGLYFGDEAYFLESILQTVEEGLRGHVCEEQLAEWMRLRLEQVRSGELLYIAHQIDYVGRAPS
ncbi:MAG: class I SAM-dependent methyltransferase [Candidatus Eremiobacteraeota bacterium]|nr:class I SAM-dependent methyltransferase [Candidatus Eremiobacteraeota bacterium]